MSALGGLDVSELVSELKERRSRRQAVLTELETTVTELGQEEVEVLVLLARRLLAGQRFYGLIDVASDPRDYEKERGDECADVLVYSAMAELRRLKRKEPAR